MRIRSIARPFVLILTALAIASTGGAQTLTYGMAGTFDKLDPNATTFTRGTRVTMHVVEPLIWQSAPGEFEPGLATRWEVSDDGLDYTFWLREGVTFHDGTPFNADAVKFTFDRIVDPETNSQTAFSLIGPYGSTEVIDDLQVKVHLTSRFAPFLDSVSSPNLGIISPAAFAQVGNDDWGLTALVGTGPFEFVSYTPDSEIILRRHEGYWGGPDFLGGQGNIQELRFLIIPEPSTLTASLETGETDFIEEVAPIDYSLLESNPSVVTLGVPQSGSGHSLMMNVQNPPMDQLAVRRAIQLAVDKEGMTAVVWNDLGHVACGPISAATFGFDPEMCELYTYDPDAAKAVLEEAGWVDTDGDGIREKDGQRLALGHYYRADDARSQQMVEYLQSDLAAVGIELQLNGLSQGGYFDAVRQGQHHMQFWWDPFNDPDGIRILLHSSNAGGGTNRNNYVNAEMDALLDEAAATTDQAERVELYSRIQHKIADEALMVFFNDPDTLYAFTRNLEGVIFFNGGQNPYFAAANLNE